MDWLLLALLVGIAAIASLAGWILLQGDPSSVGVAGTLLGAVAGFLGAFAIEHYRRRWDRSRRFEPERRALYARLLTEVRVTEAAMRQRHNMLVLRAEHPDVADRVTVPPMVDTAPLHEMVDEIELLAPPGVCRAAWLLGAAVTMLGWRADEPADDEHWRAASQTVTKSQRAFLLRASADLGTPSGVMGPWANRRYRLSKRLRRAPRPRAHTGTPPPGEP